jgi:outer membrane immunogenic protein
MKAIWLSAVGLAALSVTSSAFAADLPVKAPPPAPVLYNWTGFYIGINGAVALADHRWDYLGPLLPTGNDGAHNFTGAFGGAQAGFNYQVGTWVFGIDAQGDWGDATGSNLSALNGINSNRSVIDAFGLVEGRIGYALNNALLYVKGGGGVMHAKYDVFDAAGFTFTSASETRWGPAAGVGFELAFSDHVTIAGEYNHLFLGSRDVTFTPTADIYRISEDLDIFTVRLNYLFNGR